MPPKSPSRKRTGAAALAVFVGSAVCMAPATVTANETSKSASRPTDTRGTPAPVHPVPKTELRPSAPSPQWDVGWMLGVCGVGRNQFWAGTEFCTAGLVEAHFLRRRYGDFGVGPYAMVGTSGFFDFRGSLGGSLHVPARKLSLGARAGGYLHTFAEGAAPGVEGFLELGLRSLNFSGHYALTHTLVTGVQHTPGDASRAGTTFWIALRVDGFWLALPVGLLI